jgi:hypothetical protein
MIFLVCLEYWHDINSKHLCNIVIFLKKFRAHSCQGLQKSDVIEIYCGSERAISAAD